MLLAAVGAQRSHFGLRVDPIATMSQLELERETVLSLLGSGALRQYSVSVL